MSRLSDEYIARRIERIESAPTGTRMPREEFEASAMRELRERRAADLTPDEVNLAQRLHEWSATSPIRDLGFGIRRDLQHLLEKLLAANGARP